MNKIKNSFNCCLKKIKQHFEKYKHMYGLSTFGIFAIIKVFLLLTSFFGIHSFADVFAKDTIQLDRNVIEKYCSIDAKECALGSMNISYIAPDTFINHNNLIELHLENNYLKEFSTEGLSNLQILYIQNNQLTELNLYRLPNLRYGDISYNYFSPEWIKKNAEFLNKNKVNYLPQNEPSQNNQDKEGNFSITGFLFNDWNICSGTLLGLNILSSYQGEKIGNSILHVGVPRGFIFEDLDTNRGKPNIVYGGPGDACYADFVVGTGLYIPHINTKVDDLMKEKVDCSGRYEAKPCTIRLDPNDDPITLINSEEITSNTGIIAWNRVIFDVFTFMGKQEGNEQITRTVESIKKMMEQQFAPSTILAQICTYLGEYNLNECDVLGDLFDNNLGLENIEGCGAEVYSSSKDILINSKDTVQNIFAGRSPYVLEGIDIDLFISSQETIDTDISDNISRIHIDMKTGEGRNCNDITNTTETPYGDIATIYIITDEGRCEETMGVCIDGNMHQVDIEHIKFTPIKDNEYYDNPTCTIQSIPEAINLSITGNPTIGSELILGYEYIYDIKSMWSPLGQIFPEESIKDFIMGPNGELFLVYIHDNDNKNKYNNKTSYNVSSTIYTFSDNNWISLGQSFPQGNVRNFSVSNGGVLFLSYINHDQETSTVYTFDGCDWIKVGQERTQGTIQDILIAPDGELFLQYDNHNDKTITIHNFNGKDWIQLGQSFGDGYMGDILIGNDGKLLLSHTHLDSGINNQSIIKELLEKANAVNKQADDFVQQYDRLIQQSDDFMNDGKIAEAEELREQAQELMQQIKELREQAQDFTKQAEELDKTGSSNSYTTVVYTFDGNDWNTLGQPFLDGYVRDFIMHPNGELFLQYDNDTDKTISIHTFDGNDWIQLGESFLDGYLRDFLIGSDGNLLLQHYRPSDYGYAIFSIHTFDGNDWIQLGESFLDGYVRDFLIGSDGELFLQYDNDTNKTISIYTFDGNNWIQLGNAFSEGIVHSLVINSEGKLFLINIEGDIDHKKFQKTESKELKKSATIMATVYTFDGNNWIPVGQTFTEGDMGGLAVTPQGNILLGYHDENNETIGIYTLMDVIEGDSRYQWYRNNKEITGEVDKLYVINPKDVDTDISFSVVPVASNNMVGLLAKSKSLHIPTIVNNDTVYNGGGAYLRKDNCCVNSKLPGANKECIDFSPSYYDGDCGTQHGSADICGVGDSNYSSELKDAYLYSYSHGITTKCPIEDANLDGYLYRNHFAKMISEFAVNVLGKKPEIGKKGCDKFDDIKNETQELKGFIKTACELGLMGIKTDGETPKSSFDPNEILTRAEFGTVLSRLLRGTKHAGGTPYYEAHLNALNKANIMKKINNPYVEELRCRSMLMFIRAFEK